MKLILILISLFLLIASIIMQFCRVDLDYIIIVLYSTVLTISVSGLIKEKKC